MKSYQVEVNDELNRILEEKAAANKTSIEKIIELVLSRYAISPHILDSEDVKKAYAECGELNLDWANQ